MGRKEKVASAYVPIRCKMGSGETLLCSTGNSVWGSVMTWRDGIGEGREGIYG